MVRIANLGRSLTAQVLMLVLGAIVVAQAVTILAVYLEPPAAPPTFSFAQIATALKGEGLAIDQGRSLRRTVAPIAPTELLSGAPSLESNRLAAALGVDLQDVRLRRRGPPSFVMLTSGRRPMSRPPGPPPGALAPGAFAPGASVQGPPIDGPGFAAFDRDQQSLRGEFIAGWRQADGSWVVVQPAPELEWLRRIAIWVGGGLLVMGPIGYWFARRISAPLTSLARSAEILGRDPTAAAPLMVSGPAEVGIAARALNAMQVRLQRYVSDRVGMIGAISHDLRTPLTRIRFKLEMAEPVIRDAVLSDVVKMEQMINAVIAFSRDSATGVRQPLDLTSLIACVVDEAAAAGGDAEAELGDPLIVDGDPVALQRLFDNLIANALKYGSRARVSIALRLGAPSGDEVLVSIRDSGPGLPQQELEKVFTPFYRTELAQQRTDSGVGLGLSIARAVARAHGGEVQLHSNAEGLLAEVRLPLAPPPTAAA